MRCSALRRSVLICDCSWRLRVLVAASRLIRNRRRRRLRFSATRIFWKRLRASRRARMFERRFWNMSVRVSSSSSSSGASSPPARRACATRFSPRLMAFSRSLLVSLELSRFSRICLARYAPPRVNVLYPTPASRPLALMRTLSSFGRGASLSPTRRSSSRCSFSHTVMRASRVESSESVVDTSPESSSSPSSPSDSSDDSELVSNRSSELMDSDSDPRAGRPIASRSSSSEASSLSSLRSSFFSCSKASRSWNAQSPSCFILNSASASSSSAASFRSGFEARSHTPTLRSALPVTNMSRKMATHVIPPSCFRRVRRQRKLSVSQSRAVPSLDPESSVRASTSSARHVTVPRWPTISPTTSPVRQFHARMVASALPVKTRVAVIATHVTARPWPARSVARYAACVSSRRFRSFSASSTEMRPRATRDATACTSCLPSAAAEPPAGFPLALALSLSLLAASCPSAASSSASFPGTPPPASTAPAKCSTSVRLPILPAATSRAIRLSLLRPPSRPRPRTPRASSAFQLPGMTRTALVTIGGARASCARRALAALASSSLSSPASSSRKSAAAAA
mmetsp:Transcript_18925/g.72178  ORF Transcript_18925/g.72178 Transcript_18925/m.72178 type:complete len:572 (+) Transcript_18925:170-1885(+)